LFFKQIRFFFTARLPSRMVKLLLEFTFDLPHGAVSRFPPGTISVCKFRSPAGPDPLFWPFQPPVLPSPLAVPFRYHHPKQPCFFPPAFSVFGCVLRSFLFSRRPLHIPAFCRFAPPDFLGFGKLTNLAVKKTLRLPPGRAEACP